MSDTQPTVDLIVQGTLFQDIVMTGLSALPAPGTEVHCDGMASCPGGVANMAVAARRLGLRTAMSAAFGDDGYGDILWHILADQEHIDLSPSWRCPGWHTPVTISLAINRDRAMVTHEHPPLPSTEPPIVPRARAACVGLGDPEDPWLQQAHEQGAMLFGDVGWDETGKWESDGLAGIELLTAFTPNSAEAMAYTRTEDPRAALMALADRVPVAVVTCGGQGSIGLDSRTGEEEWVPALPVNAVDPTGAGDVFAAAFITASLRQWPLKHRLAFANLCGALAVQQVGGSLAAPGWGDIADWLADIRRRAASGSRPASVMERGYAFLTEVIPPEACAVRRASATIARFSDA